MDDLDFTKGPLKDLMDAGKLHDFLLVKAPDIKGTSYHDENDEPVDCNIYHPKYGYDGHVADKYQFTITNYNPKVYTDPRSGKTVWCRNRLEILCIHEGGILTNKDGERIIIAHLSFPQQKLATPADFKEIYDRELERKGLIDKPYNQKVFNDSLGKHVQELVELHEQKTTYENRELGWIELAKEFQQYLIDSSKKKEHTSVNSAFLNNVKDSKPYRYFERKKLIEDEFLTLNAEWLNRQTRRFEAHINRLLFPQHEATPLITEEYQRVTIQLNEHGEDWLFVETESMDSIIGYVLQGDSEASSSEEDFLNAIQERFENCQQVYQLTGYLKWLKDKHNCYSMPQVTNLQPQPSDERSKFNNMLLGEVKRWFMQLSVRKNKEGAVLLSEKQTEQFIEYAFQKKQPLPNKLIINYGSKGKWNFVRLFNEYYIECTKSRGNKRPVDDRPLIRDQYIKLLTDNFEGFEFNEVKENFTTKTGKSWIP